MTLFDDEQLLFNEEKHQYTYDGEELTSVTTFINTFKRGFDEKYWSKRKATEMREQVKKGEFPDYIKKVYPEDWEREYERRLGLKTFITAKDIKKAWQKKGDDARSDGTNVHNEVEAYFNGDLMLEEIEDIRTHQAINYYNQKANVYDFDFRAPEVRVADPDLGLAGTIDLVCLDGEDVFLFDWKTNQKDLESGYGKLLKPVSELPDTSFSLYTLQLSTYAYMLERQGLIIKKLFLAHLLPEGGCLYEVDYRRELVEEMINIWQRKKQD